MLKNQEQLMKKLVLVRHAKSSWDNPEWSDFERPLNKRGIRDAGILCSTLKEKNLSPKLILSSPANRALTTAQMFAETLNYPVGDIRQDYGIYEKGAHYILNLINKLPADIDNVFIFGHNPDITSMASFFSGEYFDNVPTCGIIGLQFDIESWEEADSDLGKIIFFEYPKKFIDKINS